MQTKSKLIIGFGYKAQSGKDTAADYLVKEHQFMRVAFADTLKESCRAVFNFSTEQLYGELKQTIDPFWNKTPREYLQIIGDGFRKFIDPLIWVKAIERKTQLIKGNIVIADIRYLNEIIFIHNIGGMAVKINRNHYELRDKQATHTSEVELDGYKEWDCEIDNNGTKEELYTNLDKMLTQITR
jgi:hypothetical protein